MTSNPYDAPFNRNPYDGLSPLDPPPPGRPQGRLSPERRAYLDQVLPGWDAPDPKSDEHFFAKADECAVWVAEHGRLPKQLEKPWCRWFTDVRRRIGHLSPERRAYLDEHLPGWDAPR